MGAGARKGPWQGAGDHSPRDEPLCAVARANTVASVQRPARLHATRGRSRFDGAILSAPSATGRGARARGTVLPSFVSYFMSFLHRNIRWLVCAALVACGEGTEPPASRVVDRVVLSASRSTLLVGDTVQLDAAILDAAGAPVSGRRVTWRSSSVTIVTVDDSGSAIAIAPGTARITATVDAVDGTFDITVSGDAGPPPVENAAPGVGFEYLVPGVFDEALPQALTLVFRSPVDAPHVQFAMIDRRDTLVMHRRAPYTYELVLERDVLDAIPTRAASATKQVGWVIAPQKQGGPVALNLYVPVLPAGAPRAAVRALSAAAQRGDYVLNLRDDEAKPGLQGEQQRLARAAYAFLPDEVDFLAFVDQSFVHLNRSGGAVRNAVRGIGLATFDVGALYGSGSRLQGVITYPLTTLFTLSELAASHELGHRWLSYFSREELQLSSSGHWALSTITGGVMGYSNTQNGQGQTLPGPIVPAGSAWRILCGSQLYVPPFNDLELYIMGLLPQDSVGEHLIFLDHTQTNSLTCATVLHGPVRRVDIDDVVEEFGSRDPAYPDTPRAFRLATVVVSRGRLLDEAELSWYEYVARLGESESPDLASFYTLTGGRGRLVTRLP